MLNEVEEKPMRQRKISLGQPMHPPTGEILTLEKNIRAATLPHPILETLKFGKHLLHILCKCEVFLVLAEAMMERPGTLTIPTQGKQGGTIPQSSSFNVPFPESGKQDIVSK